MENGYHTFGKWLEEDHDFPDQQKRQLSALDKKLTPITINRDLKQATFKGSKTYYTTNLDSCECVDFNRRKLPCKHIYRLAMELGEFPGIDNAKHTNPEDLTKRDSDPKLSVNEVMDLISCLSKDEIIEFGYLCYRCGNENKKGSQKADDAVAEKLVEMGLIIQDDSVPKRYRRARYLLDSKIDRDAMRIHYAIRKIYPSESDGSSVFMD